MPLLKLFHLLVQYNIPVTKEHSFLCLDLDPAHMTPRIKKILTLILLQARPDYFTVLRGIPPCWLPLAEPGIIYPGLSRHSCGPIAACAKCALQSTCPGWPIRTPAPASSAQPLASIPLEVVLEITGRCNLSCHYCTGLKQSRAQLSLPQVRSVLNEAIALGIRAVRFTGGEPFLHPQAMDMLILARKMGFYVLLNTNATVLTNDIAKTLHGTVDNVLVSLQACDPASEARLTNDTRHSFADKLHNLLRLQRLIPVMRLGTVVSRTVLDHFPRYASLVKSLHPYTWELFRPMSPADPLNAIGITEYQKLLINLLRLQKEGVHAVLANGMPFCVLPNLKAAASVLPGASSDDGHSRLVMDARGFFKASYFMPENLGNTIIEAWTNPLRRRNLNSEHYPSACHSCSFFRWCRGGSRVMARHQNGLYQSIDPFFTPRPVNTLKI